MKKWKIVSGVILVAVVCICLAYGYFIEPNRLVVNESTIHIKNLNPAFNGLRIVMLGDVHGGSNGVTEEKLRQVVATINEQNADIVVMLGDFVSEKYFEGPPAGRELKMPAATIADNLAGMRSLSGVYAVLGNHDGDYGPDVVANELTRVGIKVLRNEIAFIERNGQRLRIYGMTDHLSLKGGWIRTSAESKENLSTTTGDVIVLQHGPDILPVITGEYSISPELRLILAAHTHGGQVRLPILGSPIVPSGYGQKYVRGHINEKGVDMFVTTGLGCSILPVRFMVPPEIVVLTIVRADI